MKFITGPTKEASISLKPHFMIYSPGWSLRQFCIIPTVGLPTGFIQAQTKPDSILARFTRSYIFVKDAIVFLRHLKSLLWKCNKWNWLTVVNCCYISFKRYRWTFDALLGFTLIFAKLDTLLHVVCRCSSMFFLTRMGASLNTPVTRL